MADNINDDISAIIKTEGGLVNNPADPGGRTFEGISATANPDLWKDGPPSDTQVRQRYLDKYVKGPGFDKVTDPKLQFQLIDFGVTSSPTIAIQKLQEILGVQVDGVLGVNTLATLGNTDSKEVNNKLAIARLKMIGRLISRNTAQAKFALGWISRACEFFV